MSNIPYTYGEFHYIAKGKTKSEVESVAKKLGKKKSNYRIVIKEVTYYKSFWDELFGSKPKTEKFYVLYGKD
jgi:hypothetical protein